MRTIHRTIVSALIFSDDEKLLMGLKDPQGGGVYIDCWHIPGGGAENGETLRQTLHREMLEEVGLDVGGCTVALADDKGVGQSEKTLEDTGEVVICKMRFNVYRVDVPHYSNDFVLKTSDELVKLERVEMRELNRYKVTPPSQELFMRIGYIV